VLSIEASDPDPTTPIYDAGDHLMPGAIYPDVVFRKRQG